MHSCIQTCWCNAVYPAAGVVLTHANLIANAAGNAEISLAWPAGSRHISYLPLAHIFERKNIMMAVHYACSIGFYR